MSSLRTFLDPTLQISGSIFYITHKFLPDNWPKVNRERMLIAGGAAGLAAAFNTPLGGIVFAIEELSKSSLNTFKSTLLYAVIFSGMTVQWILGPYLYLGYPKVDTTSFSMLGYVIIFSAIAGIFASSLSTGSILGHLLLNFFDLDGNNKLLILVTMIGLLTGVTRAPFTSSILVLEMTNSHSAIFFFILAGLISSVTARLIDKMPLYKRLEISYLY
jgi:H+/Cl- antiporter ClcA